MIKQHVTVELKNELNQPYAHAIITAILTKTDIDSDGSYIAPASETWRTDANGIAVLELWPNVLGTQGSRYQITGASVKGKVILNVYAVVPNVACNLTDIAEDITCFEGCYEPTNGGSTTDIATAIQAHEAKPNPHPQYARTGDIASAVSAHESKTDPHSQYIQKTEKGVTLATLEDGKVPDSQLPSSIGGNMHLAGDWDANTNTPLLESGTGTKGATYRVVVKGVTDIDGQSDWLKDDLAIFDGATWQRIEAGAKVLSVNGKTGFVTLNAEEITETTNAKIMTGAERTKLAGIAAQATKNDTDANLKNRANHTGTQSADTIISGTNNKVFTATEQIKLANIAANATANSSDSDLLDRANHTGTQAIATIEGLPELLSEKGDVSASSTAADAIAVFASSTSKDIAASKVKIDGSGNIYGHGKRLIVFSGTSMILNASHAGCVIWCTNDTAPISIFLPDHLSEAIAVGFATEIVQASVQLVSLIPIGNSQILTASMPTRSNARYSRFNVIKQNLNHWWIELVNNNTGASSNDSAPLILSQDIELIEGGEYWLNFSNGVFNVTLPEYIWPLSVFTFLIIAGDVAAEDIPPRIIANGNKINGVNEDLELDVNYCQFSLSNSMDVEYGLICRGAV